MNERIQELAARIYGSQATEQEIKFAELIVRKCLALADKIRDGCEADGEDEQALGAEWVGLAIARHFGVEE